MGAHLCTFRTSKLFRLPRLSVHPWFRHSVRHYVCLKTSPNSCSLSQNVTIKSYLVCVMSEKYAFWVTLRPHSDRCCQGKAKLSIFDFKTRWSEFHKASQTTAPQGEAELCIYNLKNLTLPESVPSSCVRQHT